MIKRSQKKKHFAKKIPLYKRSWITLSPKQKSKRKLSLEVLNIKRNSNQSLYKIAKNHGISIATVIKNTNAFTKMNGRWIAKKYDRIPRMMIINENGQARSIEIKDSRIASAIGSYHNAVKSFLDTGDTTNLEKFRKMKIKDANGKIHFLETRGQEIIDINQRIEEPENYEVYGK